jgi:hypothetical protein
VCKLAILLLLGAFGSTAFAGIPTTVAGVEDLMQSLHGKPDGDVAEKVATLELTERASSTRLSRWQADFKGRLAREALLALADASAFLDLPKADIPSIAMPDEAARKQILSRTIEYVKTTIHQLPNFSARRSTTHFEDLPKTEALTLFYSLQTPDLIPRPLRVLDRGSKIVTYLNGLEVADADDRADGGARRGKKPRSPGTRLTSSGEFGPILSVVVGDAIRGQVFWGHWEQGAAGPMAVLRYVVPQSISHYAVALAKFGNEGQAQYPAYHGEIAVNPADGSILRLTMESEINPPQRLSSPASSWNTAPYPLEIALTFAQ